MNNRLSEWHATVPPHEETSQFAPSDIFDGYFANAMVLLYYPSSILPSTSGDELRILAEYSCKSIEAYKQGFRCGKLRFYWRTVHNLFRSGVAAVYCIRIASLNGHLETRVDELRAAFASRLPIAGAYTAHQAWAAQCRHPWRCSP